MAAAAANPTGGTRDEPSGLAAVAAASAFVGAPELAASALFGPSPYQSAADYPDGFYQGNARAFLDNFEDSSGIDGGLSASAGARGGPRAFTGARDSVDGDDGLIDGSGVTGSSWFSGAGATGVRFTYSGNDLPTAFGLVGTNGAGAISFSAFDGNGNQLVSQAFSGIPDGSFGGTTAEDQFFGVTYDDGIKSIFIFNSACDIEIDLVQYGQMFNWALMIAGLGGVGVFARRRR